MIIRVLIKRLIKASIPIVIVPCVISILIIYYFGFTPTTLLAIILLGEFYIVWAQLEVALRQTHLQTIQYEPEFKLETKENLEKSEIDLYLINTGKHLARNLIVSINVIDDEGKRKEHKLLTYTNLAPNDKEYLHSIKVDDLKENRVEVNVSYVNVIGEYGEVTFVKDFMFPNFVSIKPVKMPGLLLNSIEEISIAIKLLKHSIKLRRK